MDLNELNIIPHRIPLPFRLNHVNCFLAKGEEGWTIIDAGLGYQITRDSWEEVFNTHNIKPEDVKTILLTHFHPDHYGFCGSLQAWTGAQVLMSEAGYQASQEAWAPEQFEKQKANFTLCGVPPHLVEDIYASSYQFYDWVRPHITSQRFVQEGDYFNFAGLSFETVHTSGHAEGHICLYNKEKKILFAGDQVLPKITPNISYLFSGDPNPLQSFIHSLEKLKKLDIEFAIPSHGTPFTNVHERIEELIKHHQLRLEELLDIISNASNSNAYGITLKLFRPELNTHDLRFAIGETMSHLQYLIHQGEIAQENVNGVTHYFRK